MRTPKKLVVFRNGDPSVRHTVVLHKKTTPSYESILDYISELMQFHVVKLYTPDGRRVSVQNPNATNFTRVFVQESLLAHILVA